MKQSDIVQLAVTRIRQAAKRGSNRVLKGMVLDLYVLGIQEGMRLLKEQLKDRIKSTDTDVELVLEGDTLDNESINNGDGTSGVGRESPSDISEGSPGSDADDTNSSERS